MNYFSRFYRGFQRSGLIALLLSSAAIASAAPAPPTLKTLAGPLSYGRNLQNQHCEIKLNGKLIQHWDCEFAYDPRLLGHFKGQLGPLAEVIVLQELPMGNACNGGSLHFIGITPKKQLKLSAPMDFCGGKDPVLKRQDQGLLITLPGGPDNHGEGLIPTERWRYHNGKLSPMK